MRRPRPLAALLLGLVWGCGGEAPEPASAPEAARTPPPLTPAMPVEPIGDDLAVISGYRNGNVLVIRRDTALVLVDAQSAERVAELAAALADGGFTEPVEAVVNTHYHTDHVGGNAHWRAQGARVWAHAAAPAEMAKDTFVAERDWRRTAEPPEAMPTDLVRDSARLGSADRPVVLHHRPGAHTRGDLVVWLPAEDVLHMGDIVEIGATPFVDHWAGGTLAGMIAAVEWALEVAGPETVIVPGHGPLIDRARLERYLATLQEEAARCQAGGMGFGCREGG